MDEREHDLSGMRTKVRELQAHPDDSLNAANRRSLRFGLATLFIATTVIAVDLAIVIWNPIIGWACFAVTVSVVTIHLSRTLWNSSTARATWHAMIAGGVFFGVPVGGSLAATILYHGLIVGGVRMAPSDVPLLLILLLLAAIVILAAGLSIGVAALISYMFLRACGEVHRTILAKVSTLKTSQNARVSDSADREG